jgi:hypothetical protein
MKNFDNRLSISRHLLPLPSQMIAFVKLWRYPCPTYSEIFSQLHGVNGRGIRLVQFLKQEKPDEDNSIDQ